MTSRWLAGWLAVWLYEWPIRTVTIFFHAILFSNVGVPYIEVMIALMVQLKETSGTIILFETIGGPPKSNHQERE